MSDKYNCPKEIINYDLIDKIRKDLPDDMELLKLEYFFKMFSDDTRMRILYALSYGELCVCDIAVFIGITQSGVSHQLSALKKNGLVKSRRQGRNIYYSLDDDHVLEIIKQGMEHISHM